MSAFTRRYILQYLFALLIPVLAVSAAALLADWVAGFKIWYYDDKAYLFLHSIKENIFTIILLTVVVVGIFTTIRFIRKPLKYVEDVIRAAKDLTAPTDDPIELPSALAEAQYELNSVRETALRNAAIAREAEQRKNDMIVYLAHDLKTPLTSVIGYLSLLRDEPDISRENRLKYTAVALDRSQRLEELINEFFDITRFSLTTLTLELQRIDLSLMLNQTVSEFAPILAEHSLTAKPDIQPGVDLMCDPDKLERVFDNLLRNAVKYTPSGGTVSFRIIQETT
ncbi:MAG: HAMP domain-containing histidine kinase, partial [Oscillospiraceae bacterium]|nr:HAMP domain-containing histidine kinase [Oscillospiraceae bacterium]